MEKFEIVILANSVKHNQHCVAGKCIASGKWIRPVSNESGAELSDRQVLCRNPYGTFGVKPLQKVFICFAAHAPLLHQPENYVIDGSLWQQNFVFRKEGLVYLLDNPDDIWGRGDRVDYNKISSKEFVIYQSLYLIAVEKLKLYLNNYNRRRASFFYHGIEYDLAVTDPNFDKIKNNNYEIKSILCISLGGEFQGNCYKLVVNIF